MKKKLLIVLVALLLISPVLAANVTYPDEYYTLGEIADRIALHKSVKVDGSIDAWGYYFVVDRASYASALELRRQTILMEKQNELLAEQNEILRRHFEPEYNERSGDYPNCIKSESIYGPVYTCTYNGTITN